MNQSTAPPGLFNGMDWADQKHDIYVIDREGKESHQQLEHSAESIDAWVGEMLKLAGGQPIAIMLEQSRGALRRSTSLPTVHDDTAPGAKPAIACSAIAA